MRKLLLILGLFVFTTIYLNAQQTTPIEVYIDENFDDGLLPTNWTNSAISGSYDWKIGLDGAFEPGNGGFGINNIDGTRMLYFDDDSLGDAILNNTPSIETATFDNSGNTYTFLEFDYNFKTAAQFGVIDSFYVEAWDGTSWNLVFTEKEDNCGDYDRGASVDDCDTADFPHAIINLSAYKNANAKVRFVYHDGNDWAFYVAVDNIFIYSPQEVDLNPGKVLSPVSDCGLSASELVQIMVYNTGGSEVRAFDVRLNINDSAQIITESFTDTIAPFDSTIIEFAGTADFIAPDIYNIEVAITTTNDTLQTNDTTVTVLKNDTVYSSEYYSSFEGFEDEWTSGGDSMQWERGFPVGRVISSSRRGNFSWVTKLDGYHLDLDLKGSTITSPCFDFSQALGDPIFSFDLFTHLADNNDLLRIQTSIDNGQTWNNVRRSGIASNWYNNPPQTGWTFQTLGWKRVENVLNDLAGEAQVRIRFIFTSDSENPANPTRHDGCAIDGFRLEVPDSLNLATRELIYPVEGFWPECGYGSENVTVRVENRGATDVDTFIIGYQIDNEPVVKDTINQTLFVNTSRSYTFDEPGDFSERGGTYRLAVWVEALGDGVPENDTIANVKIDNLGPSNRITPLKQNFDNWTPGSAINNDGDIIKDGWIRSNPGLNTTWRVANSGQFTNANTGPNANHTVGNPNGNFAYIETTEGDSGQFASLETPCVDFSQKSAVQLDFWYYRFGNVMSNLIIDVFDGTQWIDSVDVIAARPQSNKNQAWSPRSVNLNQFAGKKIKIRFKGQKLIQNAQGGDQGDIAIDDVILYEPSINDVEFIQFLAPISDCNIGSSSDVQVQFQNFGTGTIPADSLILTCVYYPKDDPFAADTLIDTIRFDILAKDTVQAYTFTEKANVSGSGVTYEFNVWSTLASDANYGNDSLFRYEATNYTKLPGYIETFESQTEFIDGSCLNPFQDFIGEGWTVGNTNYNWNLQNARTCLGPNGATASIGTGPLGDHTTGEGKFFYTESTLTGGVAELISPCVDFSQSSSAAVAFWYHMFGPQIGNLYIDVFSEGTWTLAVDSIIGQQQIIAEEAWRLKGVNLGQFAGKLIQVRFRSTQFGGTGDIAIDDVEFFQPIPQDARVTEVITPVTQCSPPGVVKIALENFGLDTILGGKILVNFRANGSAIFSDTIQRGIGVGDSIHHTFTSIGNFGRVNTVYTLLAWTELENDSNVFNDTLKYRFTNITQSTAYNETFESFRDGGCAAIGDLFTRGWYSDPDQFDAPIGARPHWNVQTAACLGAAAQGNVGPQSDGTTGRGLYFYLQTAGTNGNTANLVTPCIDFTNDTTAGMLFNYHITGPGNPKLYIDILTDTGFAFAVDSVVGTFQQFKGDSWIEYAVKLEEFAGQEIQIFFRGIADQGDIIAIDDVSFYFPQSKDARMLSILTPVSDCDLFESSVVSIEMDNFGTTPISRDSLFVFYQINDLPPVGEKVLYDTVFKEPSVIDTIYRLLGVDSSYTHIFRTTGDFSGAGDVYNIKAWTSLGAEQNIDNDTLFTYTLYNETKVPDFFEDFEGFRDAGCASNIGQALNNGWTTYNTGAYAWNVQNSLCGKNDGVTPTFGTGPNGDHTKGDGIFLYAESSTPDDLPIGGTAYFESSCFDIAKNAKTHLSYYYYMFGDGIGRLWTEVYLDSNIYDKAGLRAVKDLINTNFIDSSDFDQFILPPSPPRDPDSLKNVKIDSTIKSYFNSWRRVGSIIQGEKVFSEDRNWLQRVVDLSDFVGQRIKLRFVSVAGGQIRGDIAIDDILLYEPSTVDVGVRNVLQPDVDGCLVGLRNVTAEVVNYGLNDIASGDVAMEYIIRGNVFQDTIYEQIDSGEVLNYTFGEQLDLSQYAGVQKVVVNAKLDLDTIGKNNSAFKEVVNRQPGFPRYFVDFENHSTSPAPNPRDYSVDDLQGWKRSQVPVAPGVYGWHVQCGPAPNNPAALFLPPGPPTGPSGDHTYSVTEKNGDGCYLLVESAIRPAPFIMDDEWIELPCGGIDFTQSENKQVLFSFWYHMFGQNMGDLFIDVNDGDRWLNGVDVIRGQQHFQGTERWIRHQISLDSFIVNNDVRIRFRADFLRDGGDIAIDDIEILDRAKKDARLDRVIDPDSDCDLTNAEDLKVRFQNVGTEDILETILAYQITFTPYSCRGETVRPEVAEVVRDTLVGPLGFAAPLAFQEFDFDEIDMSSPGIYQFKIWSEIAGDVNYFNDTIYETRQNLTRGFDCCEDFSDMTYGQTAGTFRDGTYPNGWDGNTAAYTFKVERNDGGVAKGNTGRNNDAFLLANDADGMPGQIARIQSPCFDLTNADAAILEFWYQAPNPNHFMLVEAQVDGGGGWTILDTLYGEGLFGVQRWTKNTQVLTNFIGNFVNIRFRAQNVGGGFYAIDDLCVKAPPPQQIDLERFVTPARGLCQYTAEEPITLRLQNVGLDRITDFKLVVQVDSAFQNFPPGQYLNDTFDVSINTNPFFDPGQKVDITLDRPEFYVNLLTPGVYWFNAEVILPGDKDESNNFIKDYPINNLIPIELPYIEDFELVKDEDGPRGVPRQTNYTNGITSLGGFYFWHEESGLDPARDGLTGPIFDHTKDSEEGTFMITNADARSLGDAAAIQTRCVDLRDAINPELKYWYHMFGFQMGDLYVQINADGGWVTIDSLLGADPDQRNHDAEWKSRNIPLTQYAGTVSRFRWLSFRGGGPAACMAIDDISVVDLAAKDLAPISLAEPTSDTNSCYSAQQELTINIRNNGSQPFDFEQDTVDVEIFIFKKCPTDPQFIFFDSLKAVINTNQVAALERDSIRQFTMPETFDMSDTGCIYKFFVNVLAQGDLINRNDRYEVEVLSQIVGGRTTLSADPSNRNWICFGTSVELQAKDYFGQLKWEEKLIRPDGTGEWFPGIFRPDNERFYIPAPDSTTDYRIRLCGSAVISDSFRINVIKPSPPKPIFDNTCRRDSPMSIKYEAVIQDFVDFVFAYDSVFWSVSRDPNRLLRPNIDYFSLGQNFNAENNIADDTLKRNIPSEITDTVYLESIVEDTRVDNGLNDGRCYSVNKSMLISEIQERPEPLFDFDSITVCQDTSFLLNAGKVKFLAPDEDGNDRFYPTTYAWSIILPNGRVVDTSNSDSSVLKNQTMVIDAYLLDKNKTYGYTLSMNSIHPDNDTVCGYATTQIKWVTIVDSCVTSIEEVSFKENFNIYPNPVTQDLYISHESVENFKGSIRLMSVEGQIIQSFEDLGFGKLNQRIEMGTLPKGIYIIKIETDRGTFIEKIIKS